MKVVSLETARWATRSQSSSLPEGHDIVWSLTTTEVLKQL